MGQTLSLCATCNVEMNNTLQGLEKQQERCSDEITRIQQRLQELNDDIGGNLFKACQEIDNLKIRLTEIHKDVEYIKVEVDKLPKQTIQ